jgi:hypothetical protein
MDWYSEKQYTKGEVFDYFGVRDNKSIFPSQICSGIIFIKKCQKSIKIIEKWLKVFYDDFSLVDDTPSKSPNFNEFIENRHDQSIWSILAKLNHVTCISHLENYNKNWDLLTQYPILAKRDKQWKKDYYLILKTKLKRFTHQIHLPF